MRRRDWKDALAREVFDWHVYGIDQESRRAGWYTGVNVTTAFFSQFGGAGSCLQLAASTKGPVGKMLSIGGDGSPDWVTATGCGSEAPWDLLGRLQDTIMDQARGLSGDPSGAGDGFHSPRFAATLCAQAIGRIKQEYCCKHRWRKVSGGGFDEPPWEGRRCEKCLMEV